MKLREIDKREIFDLIASDKPIYFTTRIDLSTITVRSLATIKSLYVEDDQPDALPKAHTEPSAAQTVPDEEPTEEETEPAPAPQEQSQAEPHAEPKRGPGRPSINKPQIVNYYLLGRQPAWIAQEMHCDLSTVYKTIREHEEKQAAKRGKA